jgi:hypothetical protein
MISCVSHTPHVFQTVNFHHPTFKFDKHRNPKDLHGCHILVNDGGILSCSTSAMTVKKNSSKACETFIGLLGASIAALQGVIGETTMWGIEVKSVSDLTTCSF